MTTRHSLEKVRADGWLDQLGDGSDGFGQLCEIVGERFVAYSVIAGVRITALTVDPRAPAQSAIDFEIGDGGHSQRLTLAEFRSRLTQAMLTSEDAPVPLGDAPDSDRIQGHIGFRYVLLAPLFGFGLVALEDDGGETTVIAEVEGAQIRLSLEDLRAKIDDAVRAELSKHSNPSPFAIDLSVIPPARDAARVGDHKKVAELLGAWPGPLSLLLRTAEGHSLSPEVRATLAEALGLLGSANVHLGRHEWAQEILRLAIQWGQERREVSAALFGRLAAAYLAEERFGEAIGIYRRALELGAPKNEMLPPLSRCFLERGRTLPALLLAERAIASGAYDPRAKDVRDAAKAKLGQTWERFRQRVPA